MKEKKDQKKKLHWGRYFFVFCLFALLFFVGKAFPAERILSEECARGECAFELDNPGQAGFQDVLIEQEKNDFDFPQLEENDIFLGQIFKANSDFVSAVELDFDVVKQHNNGGKGYVVSLKEVEQKKDSFEIQSGALAEVEFQIKDLAKFRQKNGKYRFSFDAEVEKGKYYFVGIDNSKMQVDRFNHLTLKGSREDAYTQGTAATRQDRKTKLLEGDLYFRLFGRK